MLENLFGLMHTYLANYLLIKFPIVGLRSFEQAANM